MKLFDIQAAIGTAILLLTFQCEAKHGHQLSHLNVVGRRHSHKRIAASPRVERIEGELKKRHTCEFPKDAGLVSVTPWLQNGGWALSPDQPCKRGSYCPYACPSGQVMAQWDPSATSYTYPQSMNGGLYCDDNGRVSKPFPEKPYCVQGTGAVGAQNTIGKVVSFCQTVLPGNEAMLIPTKVDTWSQLAVPGLSYWCSTAAHYYINPPSIGVEDACVWSDGSKPLGNWAPYVAGANTVANGQTFVKIGWNPIFTDSSLSKTPPTFGVKIVCSGPGCNGLPCSIDPSTDGVGGVTSFNRATGAGGADFCVVTVPEGVTANIVVFSAGDSAAGSGANGGAKAAPSPTSYSLSSTSTSSTSTSSSSTSSKALTTTLVPSKVKTTFSAYPTADNSPHILFENQTAPTTTAALPSTTGGIIIKNTTAPLTVPKNSATETSPSGSIFSLLVMFAVAGYLL